MLSSPIIKLIFFFLLLNNVNSFIDSQPDQIISFFRHGARAPFGDADPSWPPSEYGMLTPVGFRQLYILGKALSRRYSKIFDSKYDLKGIYMLSNNVERCIQSAISHLYGVYEAKGPALRNDYPYELAIPPFEYPFIKEFAKNLTNLEAIPGHYLPTIVNIAVSDNKNIFGRGGVECPLLNQLQKENLNDKKVKEALKVFEETINNVNSYLPENRKLKNANDVANFGDAMLVNLYDNRTIIGGFNDPELIRNFTYVFSWCVYYLEYGQETQRQLSAVKLISTLLEQLESYRKGSNSKKAAMFSGHDFNLYSILAAFGVVNEECIMENFKSSVKNETIPFPACTFPFYGSNIVVEFYNETKNPRVQFYYENILIPLCNNKETCSYEEFVQLAKMVMGNNTKQTYQEICFPQQKAKMTPFNSNQNESESSVEIEIIVIMGLTILVLMLLVQNINLKKKYQRFYEEESIGKSLTQEIKNIEII